MNDIYHVSVIDTGSSQQHPHGHSRLDKFILKYQEFMTPVACVVLIIIARTMGESEPPGIYLALCACVLSGYPIVRNSVVSTITNKKLNAEVLVTCALFASIWVGEYVAGAIVVLMMNIGELLEDITISKTGEAVRSLMELEAKTARVIRKGKEVELDIDRVHVGDLVLVKPGEKIPVDGTVEEGRAEVNQAPITGESMLITKEPGNNVFAGTLNQAGVLKIRATQTGTETAISKIIELVHKAQAEKPPIERTADKFASWFTPFMLGLSLLVWLFTGHILRAVTILVVACPCALVIATPTAVVAAIGCAARRGILIKGGSVIEETGKLTTVVFDKTGTLTLGMPAVRSVSAFSGISEQKVLSLAATAEKHSEHCLAEAVLKHCRENRTRASEPDDTQFIAGRGVSATKNSVQILVGNRRLFEEKGIGLNPEAQRFLEDISCSGSTGVLVGVGDEIIGGLEITDALKPGVHKAIKKIKDLGIRKIIMMTGDNLYAARSISHGIGFDEIMAELLPEDKQRQIKRLQTEGEKVAMIGDGVNDAPSLVQANAGIAMGVIGSDAAIHAADIALTGDDLENVSMAIALSRKTVSVIKQSLYISIAVNASALLLASTGCIGPVMGAIIHNLGSLLVVGNSSRLINYKFEL